MEPIFKKKFAPRQRYLACLFLLLVMLASTDGVHAQTAAVSQLPKDISRILAKIDALDRSAKNPKPVTLQLSDDGTRAIFSVKYQSSSSDGGDAVDDKKNPRLNVEFDLKASGIVQRHRLHRRNDDINVNIGLVVPQDNFEHGVTGGDNPRLVFYSKDFVFIYGVVGETAEDWSLKEWIYARRPNDPRGTRLVWRYKPDRFGWPLTIEVGEKNALGLFRNIPVNGVPFWDKVRREHVIAVVRQVFTDAYFPAHEKIGEFSRSEFWNVEGIKRAADVRIMDEPFSGRARQAIPAPPGKKGPDWSYLQSFEQNTVEFIYPARKQEYPLLIQ